MKINFKLVLRGWWVSTLYRMFFGLYVVAFVFDAQRLGLDYEFLVNRLMSVGHEFVLFNLAGHMVGAYAYYRACFVLPQGQEVKHMAAIIGVQLVLLGLAQLIHLMFIEELLLSVYFIVLTSALGLYFYKIERKPKP